MTLRGKGPIRDEVIESEFRGLYRRGNCRGIIFRDLHRLSAKCGLGVAGNSMGSMRNSANRTRTRVIASICSRVVSRSEHCGTRGVSRRFCSALGRSSRVRPRGRRFRPRGGNLSSDSVRLLRLLGSLAPRVGGVLLGRSTSGWFFGDIDGSSGVY